MRYVLPVAVCLAACGGAPEPQTPPPKAPVARAAEPVRPPHSLYRDEVQATLDAGLGTFLQRVEIEPAIRAGRFQGWGIVDLYPTDFWQAVDLRPGDVVTSVNGMPIERDTEAFAAFESLRTAKELRVQFYRGGVARELVYKILERGQKPQPDKPAVKPGSQNRSADGGRSSAAAL